jgi:hypothetical protein
MVKIEAKPQVVCLCGSTRFGEAFENAALQETLQGHIVLSIGCNMKSDADLFKHLTNDDREKIKRGLDELHKRKIDLSDEILVLNVDGYIGESTRSEIEYAKKKNVAIRYLEPTVEEKYNELITAVASVFPGESRHETALRYIREAELPTLGEACCEVKRAIDIEYFEGTRPISECSCRLV